MNKRIDGLEKRIDEQREEQKETRKDVRELRDEVAPISPDPEPEGYPYVLVKPTLSWLFKSFTEILYKF